TACGSLLSTQTSESDEPAVVTTVEPLNVEGPARFRSPTRLPALEGLPVQEAEAAAKAGGWSQVVTVEMDAERPDRVLDYVSDLVGLYVRDGIVVEAWTGG
ncbi:MAG: hypothetical protein OES24_22735, partial [Acidimicrobiia bacterium]|nr:hypothetical protein [Acidimicrobiia bacterium]